MDMKAIARTYSQGWGSLVHTLFSILVWQIAVFLPILPFTVFFPDHMEGKAEDAIYLQLACFACLLIWVPFVSVLPGPLRFTKETKQRHS
jgi:hypothetical protein